MCCLLAWSPMWGSCTRACLLTAAISYLVGYLMSQASSALMILPLCYCVPRPARLSAAERATNFIHAMATRQPSSTHYPVRRRTSGVNGKSREDLIEKLKDARCLWMVTLHQYGSKKTRHSNLHKNAMRKTTEGRSSIPGGGLVPAADVCPECGSFVPVELERSNGGEFIAEHRSGCSVCESGQRTCLASANKAGIPGSHRATSTNRRRFLDQDWRLWKVQRWIFN